MSTDRVLAWSLAANALVPLRATSAKGGQSAIYEYEGNPSLLAAMPLGTEDQKAYFRKATALLEKKFSHPEFAFPKEVLVTPRDKKTSLAFSMDRLPGESLELLLFPAERKDLGLNWDKDDWWAIARGIVRLFAVSEKEAFCQNDTHPGQYLVSFCENGKPKRVCRVDTLAFSFWHKNEFFGCDKANWEYVAPELQRLGKRPEGLKDHQLSREADRFGMPCLLFELLTGGKHNEYVGGDPDPVRRVEKKEFAVISMPDRAKVSDAVEEAYYRLGAEFDALFRRAFLGDPLKRPSPAEWLNALREKEQKARSWFVVSPLTPRPTLSRLRDIAKRHLKQSGAVALGVAALVAAWQLRPGDGGGVAPALPPFAVKNTSPTDNDTPDRVASDPAALDIPPPPRKAKDPEAMTRLNKR